MAAILEKQRSQKGGGIAGMPDSVKDEVAQYIEHLELITGVDIDGDGMEGADVRTKVDVVEKEVVELSEDQAMEAEAWKMRLKAVEENIKEVREAEIKVIRKWCAWCSAMY